MRCILATALLILCGLGVRLACAGALADVEVYDVTQGTTLQSHAFQGALYVAGEAGHRYELRVRNHSQHRLLAVTSVDGVNVVTGQTAGTDQGGYVLGPWDSVEIAGWRKSLDEVATFYFTSLPDSYAARTGRPNDVGVIGVALFREQENWPLELDERAAREAPASAPRKDTESARRDGADSRLGTGHGPRDASPAKYVDFRRASSTPDATIAIYCDSYRNLVAQGVLPRQPRMVKRQPDPFPAAFVPDP